MTTTPLPEPDLFDGITHSPSGRFTATVNGYTAGKLQAYTAAECAARDAEIERLRADAARYRWLRGRFKTYRNENHDDRRNGHEWVESAAETFISLPRVTGTIGGAHKYDTDPTRIDTAIDAALKESKS